MNEYDVIMLARLVNRLGLIVCNIWNFWKIYLFVLLFDNLQIIPLLVAMQSVRDQREKHDEVGELRIKSLYGVKVVTFLSSTIKSPQMI